jgi:hypothetical protein
MLDPRGWTTCVISAAVSARTSEGSDALSDVTELVSWLLILSVDLSVAPRILSVARPACSNRWMASGTLGCHRRLTYWMDPQPNEAFASWIDWGAAELNLQRQRLTPTTFSNHSYGRLLTKP